MEKIFIKPVAKEILMKGNTKDGPVDLFSYDSNGHNRALGNLFLVGNIQGGGTEASDDIDVGYVLNLVASLAKREYYANPDLNPKDAFTGALKKINGVVEDFFKKKDIKINIGIFTIANEQIHISKLGKFKIFLARDGKNIDILNNIQLFNKEPTQEREFSSVVSGKIMAGDRLLAFYPSRSIVTREKSLKDNLVGSTQDEFVTQLASIKEHKPDFACVALHIDIKKGSEMAVEPAIQPLELQKEPVKESPKIIAQTIAHLPPEPAIPKIIPSEFARGKRELAFSKHIHRLKNINITPRIKAYSMGGIALVAIVAIIGLKSFIFVDASDRQLNAIISEAQANLKLAQTKLSQNDFIGARSLLIGSLASITQNESNNNSSKKANDTKVQIMKALDGLDNASDATLSVVVEIPVDLGTAKLITASGNNFYAYLDQPASSAGGKGIGAVVKIIADSVGSAIQIKDTTPKSIFSSDTSVALIEPDVKKITSLSVVKSVVSTSTFSSDTLVSYEIYKDNLYGLTATGIIKIIDAALGHTTVTSWLASGAGLSADSALLAVDGNIYILSKNGVLTTYFKGKKTNETNTPVAPEVGSLLLTNTDSINLNLINISSGRIYIITKATGVVTKTLKINSSKPIASAALGADDTIYILSDNKIWKIQ